MLEHPIDLEKMTAEQAIQGTIEMWTDMMDRLGEDPFMRDRFDFKEAWLLDHGYTERAGIGTTIILGNCFLCEYAHKKVVRGAAASSKCDLCPIYWPDRSLAFHFCKGRALDYRREAIPDILAYLKNKENWRENQDGSAV